MPAGPIGIIANPASGKDVRRLVARASIFDNREKAAIVRRALIGATQAGAREFVWLADSHNIVGSAFDEFEDECSAIPADVPVSGTARDTELAAKCMQEAGCAVVLVLGGDGTSRAFARGWRTGPLIALSTGTNNVFPVFAEATVAGAAAGLIAAGHVEVDEVSRRCKIIDVGIDDKVSEIALIDAVMSGERFVGARALLDADALQYAILARAETDAVGISALGGLLEAVSADEDAGLYITFGAGEIEINAPIAPGYYRQVTVGDVKRLRFNEPVQLAGTGVMAFDGEREIVLDEGLTASFVVSRTGPAVVDIAAALQLGASRGVFTTQPTMQ